MAGRSLFASLQQHQSFENKGSDREKRMEEGRLLSGGHTRGSHLRELDIIYSRYSRNAG